MRTLKLLILSAVLVLGSAGPSAAACEPVGEIRFICGVIGPEDLAIVPGSEWIIASGNQEGGRIQLVSVRDKTTTVLVPDAGPTRADRRHDLPDVSRAARRDGRLQSPRPLSQT